MKIIIKLLTLLTFSFFIYSQESTSDDTVDLVEEVVTVGTRASLKSGLDKLILS